MKDGVLGQPARFSGKQLYVRLLPGITTNNTTNKTDTSNLKNTSMGYGVNAVFGYEDRKPVSMKLQVNKFASLNFGYNINKQDITNTNPVVKTLQKNTSSAVSLSGGMSIGYYPNSRTSVQGGGTLGIYKLLKISSGQSTGPVMFAPSVFINGNYFLNYFSRVRGNAAISYISKSNSSTGRFNFSFTVGYVQYIF